MYNLKERRSASRAVLARPQLRVRRRQQLYPFFFHMGPVALCVMSVLLIGLMAVLYLSQVGQAVDANQQLQKIRMQQATLQRQNQELVATIAREQSPAYIIENAQKMGLVPADPKKVQTLVVPGLQPYAEHEREIRP